VEAAWGCGSVTSSLAVRVALAASAPPLLSLPSGDPVLWRQRVSGWADSLAGLEASIVLPPLSLLCLCMTTFGQARRFKAPSYADVEDQRQVPPWRGAQPSRPGFDYLGRLRWSLVVGFLGRGLLSGGVHPRGRVASCHVLFASA
jgi:hypothetical protein